MHEDEEPISEFRVIGLLVIGATPVEIDFGNYRHTRINVTFGGDGIYLAASSQQTLGNYGRFQIESGSGTAAIGPTNLDGFSGIMWAVRDGVVGGNAYVSIIQWN